MKTFKDVLKEEIMKQNPRIDLTHFDEIYRVMANTQYGILKQKHCICYKKNCQKRMV